MTYLPNIMTLTKSMLCVCFSKKEKCFFFPEGGDISFPFNFWFFFLVCFCEITGKDLFGPYLKSYSGNKGKITSIMKITLRFVLLVNASGHKKIYDYLKVTLSRKKGFVKFIRNLTFFKRVKLENRPNTGV